MRTSTLPELESLACPSFSAAGLPPLVASALCLHRTFVIFARAFAAARVACQQKFVLYQEHLGPKCIYIDWKHDMQQVPTQEEVKEMTIKNMEKAPQSERDDNKEQGKSTTIDSSCLQ